MKNSGKSNKGIEPNRAVDEKETSKVNHPDNTSKPVEIHNMTANSFGSQIGDERVIPVKNIAYTNEELRED